jgi:L-threonylcarbamoyladenylate synthase
MIIMNKQEKLLSIVEAKARLLAGGVVVFPTDTVWGVGARWKSQKGVERLYEVKERDPRKPLGVLVADVDQLEELGLDFGMLAPHQHKNMVKLIKAFWPGGLTIVLPWGGKPDYCRWEMPTLGVRVPNHPVAKELLTHTGPLLQSSANFSGGLAPSTYEALDVDFTRHTHGVLAGEAGGEASSTVVDLTSSELRIVRVGCVPVSEIERVLGKIETPYSAPSSRVAAAGE